MNILFFLVLGNFVGLAALIALTIFGADIIAVSSVLALTLVLVIGSSLLGLALKPNDL